MGQREGKKRMGEGGGYTLIEGEGGVEGGACLFGEGGGGGSAAHNWPKTMDTCLNQISLLGSRAVVTGLHRHGLSKNKR